MKNAIEMHYAIVNGQWYKKNKNKNYENTLKYFV